MADDFDPAPLQAAIDEIEGRGVLPHLVEQLRGLVAKVQIGRHPDGRPFFLLRCEREETVSLRVIRDGEASEFFYLHPLRSPETPTGPEPDHGR